MITPPALKKGDRVAVVAPAGFVNKDDIEKAIAIIESWGLKVSRGEHLYKQHGIFAGDDSQRLYDLQEALDDPWIKAVICARGGYGMSRIIDNIDFRAFTLDPKWIVGYSDITVLHLIVNCNTGVSTVHGEMPLNYHKNNASSVSLDTLRKVLFQGARDYDWETVPMREGQAEGILTGGNLSLITNLMGTGIKDCLREKILFIEECDEYIYAFDRMIRGLSLAGILKDIKGLIIGGLTDMKELEVKYSTDIRDIVMANVRDYSYPLAFGFPAGHINDNRALVLGAAVSFKVSGNIASLKYG